MSKLQSTSARRLPQLDAARLLAAVLIVAVHVEPFTDWPIPHFFFDGSLTRIGLPYFFVLTGYFVFYKSFATKNVGYLINWMKMVLAIYCVLVIIYAPFWIPFVLHHAGLVGKLNSFLIAFLVNGPMFHLWYLPGVCYALVACYLFTKATEALKSGPILVFSIFLFGLLLNSWFPLASHVKIIHALALYKADKLNCSIFIGFPMIYLGYWIRTQEATLIRVLSGKLCLVLCGVGVVGLFLERIWLTHYPDGLQLNDYLALAPILGFGFLALLKLPQSLISRIPSFDYRGWSAGLYYFHVLPLLVLRSMVPTLDRALTFLIVFPATCLIVGVLMKTPAKKLFG